MTCAQNNVLENCSGILFDPKYPISQTVEQTKLTPKLQISRAIELSMERSPPLLTGPEEGRQTQGAKFKRDNPQCPVKIDLIDALCLINIIDHGYKTSV